MSCMTCVKAQVTSSSFQRDVSGTLRRLGVAHRREARTSDRMFSVDLALPGEARPGYPKP